MKCHTNINCTPSTQLPRTFSYIVAIFIGNHFESSNIQGLSELADQNNTVHSSSSGNNRENVKKKSILNSD
jgi:hypothetical protein